jgi:hypothetical protein
MVLSCPICSLSMEEEELRYHLMQCQLVSRTGDRLIDMIITFIRHSGDYKPEGADVGVVVPVLEANGWTCETCFGLIHELEADQYITKMPGYPPDRYQFNYGRKKEE